jgi:hypothetical protein
MIPNSFIAEVADLLSPVITHDDLHQLYLHYEFEATQGTSKRAVLRSAILDYASKPREAIGLIIMAVEAAGRRLTAGDYADLLKALKHEFLAAHVPWPTELDGKQTADEAVESKEAIPSHRADDRKTPKARGGRTMNPAIFISHSSRDKRFAKEVIHLLESCFVIPEGSILCTSVEGYRLESGATIPIGLRRALEHSYAVVGAITKKGLKSDWVLFELGAAWGIKKKLALLLLGLSHEDLPEILRQRVVLTVTRRADVAKFVDDISKWCAWRRRQTDRIDPAIAQFLAQMKQLNEKEGRKA